MLEATRGKNMLCNGCVNKLKVEILRRSKLNVTIQTVYHHCESNENCADELKQLIDMIDNHIQPERSKREDSKEMRCSEHCGNTVRGK